MNGDCVAKMKEMADESVDAVLCDPPYGLKFMNKDFDDLGEGKQQREWHVQWVKEAFRVLKPNGVMKAFGGTRTYQHLLAAMAEVGFSVDLSVWAYGCLSEDTEILTGEGWVEQSKLNNGSMVVSYCIDKDTYQVQAVEEVVRYEYKDTAYRIQSDHTDQIVSRNHRCIVEREGERTFLFAEHLQANEVVPFVESVSIRGLRNDLSNGYNTARAKKETLFDHSSTLSDKDLQGVSQGVSNQRENNKVLFEGMSTTYMGDESMQGVQQRVSNKEILTDLVQARMYDTAEDHKRVSRLWERVSSTRWESGASKVVLQARMSEETKGGIDLLCLPKGDPSESKKIRASKKSNLFKAVQRSSEGRGMESTRSQGAGELVTRERTSLSGENDGKHQPSVEGWGDLSQSQGELHNSEYRLCEMPNRVHLNGEERRVCDGTSFESGTSSWQTTDENRMCSSHQSQRRGQSVGELDVVQEQSGSQTVRSTWETRTTLATVTPIEYEGIVWCVKVPTGAFVARRNGKVFVTGNSGFPKSLNISKKFDSREKARTGEEGAIIGFTKGVGGENINDIVAGKEVRTTDEEGGKGVGAYGTGAKQVAVDVPVREWVTDEAKTWEGWGTSLKPAFEPVCVGYKRV
jgi:hypothetical protein